MRNIQHKLGAAHGEALAELLLILIDRRVASQEQEHE
jgi:hypothetical protein